MNFLWRVFFSINLFFLLFLAVFLSGISFKNSSFFKQPLQSKVLKKKIFFLPLIKFFKFQGSSASDLYYVTSEERQVKLNKIFNEIKDEIKKQPFVSSLLLSVLPFFSSCNGNLIKQVTSSANLLVFLKTSCSKEIIISLINETKTNFSFSEIPVIKSLQSELPKPKELTVKKKEKMIEDLEKIKSQLIWKFLRTKDWDSFKVTDARWRDINFPNLKNKKNLNFDKLLSQEKIEIIKLVKKIDKFNIESNWKAILDQELFKKETNSSHSLFIGLGIGGGVFLLIVMGTGYYFYKKHKNKQENV